MGHILTHVSVIAHRMLGGNASQTTLWWQWPMKLLKTSLYSFPPSWKQVKLCLKAPLCFYRVQSAKFCLFTISWKLPLSVAQRQKDKVLHLSTHLRPEPPPSLLGPTLNLGSSSSSSHAWTGSMAKCLPVGPQVLMYTGITTPLNARYGMTARWRRSAHSEYHHPKTPSLLRAARRRRKERKDGRRKKGCGKGGKRKEVRNEGQRGNTR